MFCLKNIPTDEQLVHHKLKLINIIGHRIFAGPWQGSGWEKAAVRDAITWVGLRRGPNVDLCRHVCLGIIIIIDSQPLLSYRTIWRQPKLQFPSK